MPDDDTIRYRVTFDLAGANSLQDVWRLITEQAIEQDLPMNNEDIDFFAEMYWREYTKPKE